MRILLSLGIVLIFSGYLCGAVYVASQTPAFAWDFLSFWGPESINFLDAMAADRPYVYDHRHPSTLPRLIMSVLRFGQHSSLWMLWGLSGTIFCFICSLVFLRRFKLYVIGPLFFLFVSGASLVENHFLLTGYAEVFMGLFLVAAVACLAASLETNSLPCFVIGALFLALSSAFKNLGPLYIAIVAFGFVVCQRFVRFNDRWPLFFSLVFGVGCGFLYLLHASQAVDFRLYFDPPRLRAFGRTMPLTMNDPRIVFENLATSLLVNASYSTLLLSTGISSLLAWQLSSIKERRVLFFSNICLALSVCAVVAGQLFTQYGFSTGLPGSDTGASRQFLPVAMLMFFSISYSMAVIFSHSLSDDGNVSSCHWGVFSD